MFLCVCGHFQLRENFYWVPAQFHFLESSQQSFHLGVTVIPILQRRRLRLRGVRYRSEITKHVRGPVTQICLTPQHMCLTLCCAEPIPEGARASHELEQVAWPLLFYPRLCILTFTKKKKKFLSKNIRAFSLLCLTTVCILYLAVLLENPFFDGEGKHAVCIRSNWLLKKD